MRLQDGSSKVVKLILDELKQGIRLLPCEVGLQYIEKETGFRAQSIGMAFDDCIAKPLKVKGIHAVKQGKPVVIRLTEIKEE